MGLIASDGPKEWRHGPPSYDPVRSFCAWNPELSYETHYPNDDDNIKGENHEHIKTFSDIVESLVQCAVPADG